MKLLVKILFISVIFAANIILPGACQKNTKIPMLGVPSPEIVAPDRIACPQGQWKNRYGQCCQVM